MCVGVHGVHRVHGSDWVCAGVYGCVQGCAVCVQGCSGVSGCVCRCARLCVGVFLYMRVWAGEHM